MASYTCISCRVAFTDGEVQRAHYKTDWHRYNLKRKVAAMPPVTAHDFQERVLAAAAAPDPPAASAGCSACGKRFSSANAFRDHLQSQRHRRAEREVQRALLVLDQKSQEKGLGHERPDHDARNQALQRARGGRQGPRPPHRGPAPPPRLLWLEEQARRRQGEEPEDGVGGRGGGGGGDGGGKRRRGRGGRGGGGGDGAGGGGRGGAPLPGAIPVTDCLFCPHHSKSLIRSLAHMTRAHSFFIPDLQFLVDLRGLIRYLGEKVGAGNVCLWCNERGRSFYSTEAVQSHMTDKSHCRLQTDGDAALEFADFYDFRSSYPEGGPEGEETPDLQVLEFDDATLELTLPSGARIGHRSLMTYYRQRFGAQRQVAPAQRDAVLRTYRALGWGGAGVGPAPQQQKDMRYVQRMKARWLLRMGMNNNSTRQKHFRAQVMF